MNLTFFLVLLSVLVTPKPMNVSPVVESDKAVECTLDLGHLEVCSSPVFDELLQTWGDFLGKGKEKITLCRVSSSDKSAIFIHYVPSLALEEYTVSMGKERIVVSASSPQGAWWALQTLTQIFVETLAGREESFDKNPEVTFPAVSIRDKPAFSYRGAHLDCCRHFFTVDEVKDFIDMMCLHKLNVFHWHLTDDQGWRMEIKKYPLLAERGAVRKETLIGHVHRDVPHRYDGIPYGEGLYYTQDQCREIVEYAARRGINVIPEIEMPGHMVAALSCYPSLGCTGGPYEVWTRWGISKDVLCLGRESSYQFVEDVLDEVCDVFPSRYIHIGGDEAPVERRKTCPDCQAKMKELGYDREEQLQGHLIGRVEKYLQDKGRELIGWNEILNTGISRNAIIMSWKGDGSSGIEAARRGNKVIMTPGKYLYFDHYQTDNPENEPLAIGGRLPLKTVYSYDPLAGLDVEQQRHILGVQANTWTEYMDNFKHVQFMDLPRMSALSELGWCSKKEEYTAFFDRMCSSMLPMYDYFGYIYARYEFGNIQKQ